MRQIHAQVNAQVDQMRRQDVFTSFSSWSLTVRMSLACFTLFFLSKDTTEWTGDGNRDGDGDGRFERGVGI